MDENSLDWDRLVSRNGTDFFSASIINMDDNDPYNIILKSCIHHMFKLPPSTSWLDSKLTCWGGGGWWVCWWRLPPPPSGSPPGLGDSSPWRRGLGPSAGCTVRSLPQHLQESWAKRLRAEMLLQGAAVPILTDSDVIQTLYRSLSWFGDCAVWPSRVRPLVARKLLGPSARLSEAAPRTPPDWATWDTHIHRLKYPNNRTNRKRFE